MSLTKFDPRSNPCQWRSASKRAKGATRSNVAPFVRSHVEPRETDRRPAAHDGASAVPRLLQGAARSRTPHVELSSYPSQGIVVTRQRFHLGVSLREVMEAQDTGPKGPAHASQPQDISDLVECSLPLTVYPHRDISADPIDCRSGTPRTVREPPDSETRRRVAGSRLRREARKADTIIVWRLCVHDQRNHPATGCELPLPIECRSACSAGIPHVGERRHTGSAQPPRSAAALSALCKKGSTLWRHT